MNQYEQEYIEPLDAYATYKEYKPVLFKKHKGCQACGNDYPNELVIHHVSYKRYGTEKITDLSLLCFRCHNEFHRMFKGSDPYLRQMTQVFIKRNGIW